MENMVAGDSFASSDNRSQYPFGSLVPVRSQRETYMRKRDQYLDAFCMFMIELIEQLKACAACCFFLARAKRPLTFSQKDSMSKIKKKKKQLIRENMSHPVAFGLTAYKDLLHWAYVHFVTHTMNGKRNISFRQKHKSSVTDQLYLAYQTKMVSPFLF